MKIELENWLHNCKPREFEWKNEQEVWSKIDCRLEKTYTTEEEIKKRFPGDIDKLAREMSDGERKELLFLANEDITIWAGKTSDDKVWIEIMVGFECDCSEYCERLTLEGEMKTVLELLQQLIPTKGEREKWFEEKWQRNKQIREYIEVTYDFKPINNWTVQIVPKSRSNDAFLKTVEQRQFFWRNIVLRSWINEEITIKRVLHSSTIHDLIATLSDGFQVQELDEWINQNFFKRGLSSRQGRSDHG